MSDIVRENISEFDELKENSGLYDFYIIRHIFFHGNFSENLLISMISEEFQQKLRNTDKNGTISMTMEEMVYDWGNFYKTKVFNIKIKKDMYKKWKTATKTKFFYWNLKSSIKIQWFIYFCKKSKIWKNNWWIIMKIKKFAYNRSKCTKKICT